MPEMLGKLIFNLRKSLPLAALTLGLFSFQAHADDQGIFNNLNDRGEKISAVAILVIVALGPQCTIDKKPMSFEDIEHFIRSYGHRHDAAILEDVKAKISENDALYMKLTPSDKKRALDFTCVVGITLTGMVRDRLDSAAPSTAPSAPTSSTGEIYTVLTCDTYSGRPGW